MQREKKKKKKMTDWLETQTHPVTDILVQLKICIDYQKRIYKVKFCIFPQNDHKTQYLICKQP